MTTLAIGPDDGLYYVHHEPQNDDQATFVFFNALTGDTGLWEAVIAPKLREAGHGTLAYNMRGQIDSPFAANRRLDSELIVSDAITLLSTVEPVRPILVGLSIGGLFAAQAWLAGAQAEALFLINTLRKETPRLQWINDALVRAVEQGGLELFRDLYLPLLMNTDWLVDNRPNFLKTDTGYVPLPPDSGAYKLLSEAGGSANWDLPYEKLTLPVAVVTGLQDHVFREPDDIAELLNRLPQSTHIEMPDAGHLIPAERPQKLADMLLSFAEEIE
jgi:pimeloyl-ACP methyl ester carboxylesterase